MEVIRKERPHAVEHHSIKQVKEDPTRYNTWVTKGREIDF